MNNFKRIMISAISTLLCVSMVACGNNNVEDDTTTTTTGDVTTTAPAGDNTSASETTTEAPAEDKAAIVTPDVGADTMGGKLWNAFLTTIEANPETTPEEMANTLLTNEVIQFMGGAMAVEPGQEFFNGFKEYKITGFDQAALYMPMIGSIPFIGYIFELSEGTDVDAFIKSLDENADMRWLMCVAADQKVIGAYENTVFFLMCRNAAE